MTFLWHQERLFWDRRLKVAILWHCNLMWTKSTDQPKGIENFDVWERKEKRTVAMEEEQFNKLLQLFPVVRPRSYCVCISNQYDFVIWSFAVKPYWYLIAFMYIFIKMPPFSRQCNFGDRSVIDMLLFLTIFYTFWSHSKLWKCTWFTNLSWW